MGVTGPDARIYPRASIEIEISLESEHNFFLGFSENISEGGLFVATHTMYPVGTEIDVSFILPGRMQPIRAHAEVRWVRVYSDSSDAPPGIGVRFLSLDEADVQIIRNFVNRRPPIFWDDE